MTAGRVFIALGSNLGDSPAVLRDAFNHLESLSGAPVRRSSLWTSTPVDCPPGSPRFVNAMAELRALPGQTPESLLATLQELEREFGRRPKVILNEPRPLDLDLIAWDDLTRSTPFLTLPHPRAHLRRFVLQPFAELAPDYHLPGQSAAIAELLAHLQTDEVLQPLEAADKPPR
jgi:2-amino-4-hydroxy-6-hydroxymethyldihydropteridine diphosphokinase